MKTPHVLLIEAEPGLVMALERRLRSNRIAVSIARDGAEALAAIAHTPFDLVLLDLRMPDVDGPLIGRQLRRRPGRAPAKVVFLAARGRETAPPGSDLCIARPCSTRRVVAAVCALLPAAE